MSLPTAKRDISEKPTKGSVVDPVNKKLKEEDVERKIKILTVVQAISANKYPTNAQIDSTLAYTLSHSPISEQELSDDGKKLIEDVRRIIETSRLIVSQKNADELVQAWLYGLRKNDSKVKGHANALKSTAANVVEDSAPSEEKRKGDAEQALQHIRTLFRLILTNSEVRKLISDTGLVGRDLLARGAGKAASKLAPSSTNLARVDDSAPRDEFVQDDTAEDILKGRLPGFKKKAEAKETKEELESELRAVDESQSITSSERERRKKGLGEKLKNLTTLSPENREKLDQQKERARTFLMEEYFPKERRDQWIYRFKKVIIECQKHEDYQESLRWLLKAVEEYVGHAQTAISSTSPSTSSVASDPEIRTTLSQLREILERFAGGRKIDSTLENIKRLAQIAREDEELRSWFHEVDAYIRKVLLDAGYVIEPACNKRGKELRESGRRFFEDKYRAQFDDLFKSLQVFLKGFNEDPLNKRFGEDWARLTKDLLFDEEGKTLKFKKHLFTDIRSHILPQLVDKIGYVPIPRIEYTDDSVDMVVEGLVLSGRNLFPNIVTLEAHNYVKFSPYTSIKDEHRHEFKIGLKGIQADMRDVGFYFKMKKGIARVKDSGFADVLIGGEGVSATVHVVSSAKNDESSVFSVKKVDVKVEGLKFSIRDSKHDFLYKTIKPLATSLIKRQIAKAIQDGIRTGLEYFDGQLVGVKERAREAKARQRAEAADSDSKMSEEGRLKIWKEAFKRPVSPPATVSSDGAGGVAMKGHKRSGSTASQFKVVSDKRKSLFAARGEDVGVKGGWVGRTEERAELTRQGQDWKSPVFDIVGEKSAPAPLTNGTTANGGKTNGTVAPVTNGVATSGANHQVSAAA